MSTSPERRWLAFDTSTDVLSLAVARGDQVWTQTLPGGPQASSGLIPAVLAMLAESDMPLASLDAIVFGRGPGSFTGLRTACAVAQGLAYAARHGQLSESRLERHALPGRLQNRRNHGLA